MFLCFCCGFMCLLCVCFIVCLFCCVLTVEADKERYNEGMCLFFGVFSVCGVGLLNVFCCVFCRGQWECSRSATSFSCASEW